MSRGEADKPRYKEFRTDPVKFVENATALEQVEEEQRKIAATKFEEEMDVRELTKHVLPSDWKTNSRYVMPACKSSNKPSARARIFHSLCPEFRAMRVLPSDSLNHRI